MATRLHLLPFLTYTMPWTHEQVSLMREAAGTSVGTFLTTSEGGATEHQWTVATLPMSFLSERLAAPVTIAGQVTVNVHTFEYQGDTVNATVRARVYKITAGGSNVESLIGEVDGTTRMAVSADGISPAATEFTLTFTPAASIAMVENERLVLRVYLIPMAATLEYGPDNGLRVGKATAGNGYSYLEFTETLTFKPNITKLYLRRTTAAGIDTFRDLLPARGVSAFTTTVTRVVAGATTPMTHADSMVITATEITAAAIASTSNVATYASAAFTPVANRLYLLAVVHSDAAAEATVPTVATTTGLTWVQVGSSMAFDTIASNVHRLTLFRAMKASGLSNGTYTVTLADNGTGCCTTLLEVVNVLTTGTDGADAVRNISTGAGDATTNPTVTLGAFLQVYNGIAAFYGTDIATAPTIGTGFTGLTAGTYATPTTGIYGQWRADNDGAGAKNCVLTTSDWAAIAVELVATPPVLAEWISPPVKHGFWYAQPSATIPAAATSMWVGESNAAANAKLELRLFRWRAGVETQCSDGHVGAEAVVYPPSFTNGHNTGGNGTVTATPFLPDDRMILRLYVQSTGSAGHLVTLDYDHSAAGVDGDCWLDLYHFYNGPEFKAEADPVDAVSVPSTMMTGGVGS